MLCLQRPNVKGKLTVGLNNKGHGFSVDLLDYDSKLLAIDADLDLVSAFSLCSAPTPRVLAIQASVLSFELHDATLDVVDSPVNHVDLANKRRDCHRQYKANENANQERAGVVGVSFSHGSEFTF